MSAFEVRDVLLSLKITSITMAAETRFDTWDSEGNDLPDNKRRLVSSQGLYFDVHPVEGEHFDLETGEVFKAPGGVLRRERDEAKPISGQLAVYEASSANEITRNAMTYFGERDRIDDPTPSSIYFRYALPSRDFQTLLANIRSNMLPTTVNITLDVNITGDNAPVKYGWEPDGSGMEWSNKAEHHRHVKLSGLGFHYDILTGDELKNEETGERVHPVVAELRSMVDKINSSVHQFYWTIIIIIVIFAVISWLTG